MEHPHGRIWRPIEPLPVNWREISRPDLLAYVKVWWMTKSTLKQRNLLDEFLTKLRRESAIETGIIERLYTLSEGATRTFIEMGLDAEYINPDDTDKSPEYVVALIKDQLHAIEGIYAFVSGQRRLTKSYIRELHQVITSHQETYEAIDALGNRVSRNLVGGDWKKWPNHVQYEDGTRFEYCPPEHVEAEVDRLLALYEDYENQEVTPDVLAAWMHHRFTLIHPFEDGNGRVARCLATLVVLKHDWLPLVITRRDRVEYIKSLRGADSGELAGLVSFFDQIERRSIRRAIDLGDEVAASEHTLQEVLALAGHRLAEQRQEVAKKLQAQHVVAQELHAHLKVRLAEVARQVTELVKEYNARFSASVSDAFPNEERARTGYSMAITDYAKAHYYYANREEFASWACLRIRTEIQVELLFAVHGMGRARGVIACAAMGFQRFKDSEDEGAGTAIGDFHPLSADPFEFACEESASDVLKRFDRWIEGCVKEGIDYWRKSI